MNLLGPPSRPLEEAEGVQELAGHLACAAHCVLEAKLGESGEACKYLKDALRRYNRAVMDSETTP